MEYHHNAKSMSLHTERLLKKLDILDKSAQVFNCDETGMTSKVSTRVKAYARKGSAVYQKKVIMHALPHKFKPIFTSSPGISVI